MNRLIALFIAMLFVASASASHVYHGLAEDDPDLYGYGQDDGGVVGVQPGIGDRVDIYGGFGGGNNDLSPNPFRRGGNVGTPDTELPPIYQGFSGDPNLSW